MGSNSIWVGISGLDAMIEKVSKVSFVFPGQASQYVGMCREFLESYPPASMMFDIAESILGIDLQKACLEGPEELLTKTIYAQPAMYVHSCIADRFLAENGIRPDCAAGHSIGEISALTGAGVVSFEDGLEIVAERSRSMQEDCDNNPGTMAAIIGLEIDAINAICDSTDGIVQAANFNSPNQIVVSGEIAAVETLMKKAKEAGAKRAVRLSVGGAFHSTLMNSTPERLAKLLEAMDFIYPEFPVASNVSGGFYEPNCQVSDYLVRQIQSPVLWSPSVEFMVKWGVNTFIEVGSGNVLQGLIKRTAPQANLASFEKPEQIDAVRELTLAKTI